MTVRQDTQRSEQLTRGNLSAWGGWVPSGRNSSAIFYPGCYL